MKQKLFLILMSVTLMKSYSQTLKPSFSDYFSWNDRFGSEVLYDNYISSAKDQYVQGPCAAFAGVGGLEAILQIYFNKTINQNELNLSELHVYSTCNPDAGVTTLPFLDAIDFIVSEGIVEENCFPYPTQSGLPAGDYFGNCNAVGTCSENAYFPGYDVFYNISSINALKELIIDRGPIIAHLPNNSLNGSPYNHSLLIIGWKKVNGIHYWILKDSWPGNPRIYQTNYDVLNYNSYSFDKIYVATKIINGQVKINCNTFDENEIRWTDSDHDGFYYWGIGPKPAGCTGPCKMDFNDNDITKIFLNSNYVEVNTPTVTGSDLVCTNGTVSARTFTLRNLPTGFSTTWNVSEPTYFNSVIRTSDTTVVVSPNSQYSGDELYITCTISDGCGSAQYRKYFAINGPADSKIDINVVPSNAPTPIRVSGVWLLCPNSTYYLYCNNTSTCSTANYQWTIPSGWTKYEQSSNYIRINTNSTPFGTVNVNATTCCGTNHLVVTRNFSQGGPCSYFAVYPNPATTEFNIGFVEEFDIETLDETSTIEIYDAGFTKKYKAGKIEKNMKVKTDDWKEGIYFVIFSYKGQKYYEKIKIGR